MGPLKFDHYLILLPFNTRKSTRWTLWHVSCMIAKKTNTQMGKYSQNTQLYHQIEVKPAGGEKLRTYLPADDSSLAVCGTQIWSAWEFKHYYPRASKWVLKVWSITEGLQICQIKLYHEGEVFELSQLLQDVWSHPVWSCHVVHVLCIYSRQFI